MNKHALTLAGGHDGELRISASLLHETVGALLDGVRSATRFAVEGASVRKGPRPTWLDAACAIEITGLAPGSTVFAIEAPTLQEADATKFGDRGQNTLFNEVDGRLAEQTVVDLFGQVLASLVEGDLDDVNADRALLDSCARFAKIAGDGVQEIRLDGICGRNKPLVITREHVLHIERLRDETPPAQAARVAGILDTISATRSEVTLTLKDGTKVPARIADHDPDELRALFGKDVVVSGVAHFAPSGRLLMLNVEAIGEAADRDRLFEHAPVARNRLPILLPAAQSDSSGVSAFFGSWPGDESEQELLEALRAVE